MGGKKRERREAERAHALASKHANLDPADDDPDEQDGSAKRDDEARKIASINQGCQEGQEASCQR